MIPSLSDLQYNDASRQPAVAGSAPSSTPSAPSSIVFKIDLKLLVTDAQTLRRAAALGLVCTTPASRSCTARRPGKDAADILLHRHQLRHQGPKVQGLLHSVSTLEDRA